LEFLNNRISPVIIPNRRHHSDFSTQACHSMSEIAGHASPRPQNFERMETISGDWETINPGNHIPDNIAHRQDN
jgi:hypothetical protein